MGIAMTFIKLQHVAAIVVITAVIGLSSCATISEEQCLAGNWEDRGYKDGINGVSRDRIVDYVDTCSTHGAQVDRISYLKSYEKGLTYYCVPEKGYALGRGGSSYNSVCTGPQAEGFRLAYDEGRFEYDVETEHKRLIKALEQTEEALDDVRIRLRNPDLLDNEYRRLSEKRDRLEEARQDIRYDLRDFEREHGF